MVGNRSVDGGELLQCACLPEPKHRTFSSPERQMQILGPIVQMLAHLAAVDNGELLHRSGVGTEPIGDDPLGRAVPLQRLLHERHRGRFVAFARDVALQNFSLVIDRALEIMHLAADPDVDLVQVPPPVVISAPAAHQPPTDLRCEQRPEPVPSQPHGLLMAKVDTALGKQVLDVPQRQRKSRVEHHHQADHLGRRTEVAERVVGLAHAQWLPARPNSSLPLTVPRRLFRQMHERKGAISLVVLNAGARLMPSSSIKSEPVSEQTNSIRVD